MVAGEYSTKVPLSDLELAQRTVPPGEVLDVAQLEYDLFDLCVPLSWEISAKLDVSHVDLEIPRVN